MKILIGCEESQRVCMEFRKLGHDAYSNDIQECSGGYPEYHIQGCIFEALKMEKWDMLIAFPPCTYLSNAGACRLFPGGQLNQERYKKGLIAADFFMKLYNAPIKHVALENPTPSRIYNLPESTQVIQPYEFGERYSKRTLLWLKRLPPLRGTNYIHNHTPYITTPSYRNKNPNTKFVRNKKLRSKTFLGIAQAMATQWSTPRYIEQLKLFGDI